MVLQLVDRDPLIINSYPRPSQIDEPAKEVAYHIYTYDIHEVRRALKLTQGRGGVVTFLTQPRQP